MAEVQLARAISTEGEAETQRTARDDGFEVLRPYFREIGRFEMLTSEQEIALAKAVEDYTRAMRQEILGIPLAARLVVGRWSDLRSADQVTAKLSGLSPDRRPPDASARMDRALQRVAILLDRRDKLHGDSGRRRSQLEIRPGRGAGAHPPGDRRSARALARARPADLGGRAREAPRPLAPGTGPRFAGGFLSSFPVRRSSVNEAMSSFAQDPHFLARISHQLTTAAADSTADSRPSPSGGLDVLSSTPSAPSGPRAADLRHSRRQGSATW